MLRKELNQNATMELTQLQYAKLQLEPNHNNVENITNNTGTPDLVNTNALKLDTANGIYNLILQQLLLQLFLTHATLAKKNKVATLSQHALGMTMRRTDQSNSSQRLSAIQSILMDHKLPPCGLLASVRVTLLAHLPPANSQL